MRASVIIAALAATPLAAARACHHKRPHHHATEGAAGEAATSSPAQVEYEEPAPTIVTPEETVPEVKAPAETSAVPVVSSEPEPEPEVEEEETKEEEAPVEEKIPVIDDTPEVEEETPEPTTPSSSSGGVQSLDMGTYSGISTFYSGDLSGGTCSFTTYSLPQGMHGVALSSEGWDPTNCGACVEIKGPNGNIITAMVVDQCPTCSADHIDLFPDAFAELDDPVKGIIETSYNFVSCGISSPMKVHNKDGVSPYWFSMQVVNHNVPVESLEVSTDGGSSWQGTERTYYNFFENTGGFGTDSVDVKIRSTTGEEMIVEGVPVVSDGETGCGGNF